MQFNRQINNLTRHYERHTWRVEIRQEIRWAVCYAWIIVGKITRPEARVILSLLPRARTWSRIRVIIVVLPRKQKWFGDVPIQAIGSRVGVVGRVLIELVNVTPHLPCGPYLLVGVVAPTASLILIIRELIASINNAVVSESGRCQLGIRIPQHAVLLVVKNDSTVHAVSEQDGLVSTCLENKENLQNDKHGFIFCLRFLLSLSLHFLQY